MQTWLLPVCRERPQGQGFLFPRSFGGHRCVKVFLETNKDKILISLEFLITYNFQLPQNQKGSNCLPSTAPSELWGGGRGVHSRETSLLQMEPRLQDLTSVTAVMPLWRSCSPTATLTAVKGDHTMISVNLQIPCPPPPTHTHTHCMLSFSKRLHKTMSP